MKYSIIMNLLFIFLLTGHSLAQGSDETGYIAPEIIHKGGLKYPPYELRMGREGWVKLSWIVDIDGSVTDIIVEDSSGQKNLEKAAINAAKTYKYKPATKNGVPVKHSYKNSLISFHIEHNSQNAAKSSFVFRYNKARRLIRKGKLDEAKKVIDDLQKRKKWNLYEDANFWLLKSIYDLQTNQRTEAMKALKKATFFDKRKLGQSIKPYLSKKKYLFATAQLYSLQVEHHLYRDALDTYEKIKVAYPDSQQLVEISKNAEQIIALTHQNLLLKVSGKISNRGFWKYQILRRAFSLTDINGKLDKLIIRCSRKVFSGTAKPDSMWKIPKSFGDCTLYIYGNTDSTFQLYEHPLESS